MATAPTAEDLIRDPFVRQVLQQAWIDSLPDDPVRRHEEGGWIYMNVTFGHLTALRAQRGEQQTIDLNLPDVMLYSVVVAKFHTHPHPTLEGWDPGPSQSDEEIDEKHGVPDLIVTYQGVYVSGPQTLRGGLAGITGFPG